MQQSEERRTILIVDDEGAIRDLCARAIKGYRTLEAADGEEALKILEREPVDLVLADVMMPRLNGLDLLKLVKEKTPNQAVVIMTGFADKEVILKALRADADDFINKPINLLQLKTTIDKVLEKKALKQELLNLKRLDKLKSDFLGLISHKLKTPITAISLFIQNMARGLGDPGDPSYQETLSLILEESNHLTYLIKDLLYYSEVILQETPLELTPCQIEEIVKGVISELRYAAINKGLTLSSTMAGPFPTMNLDRQRMTFVIRALVENSIKFTPSDGVITLEGSVVDGTLRLVVTDNGEGIPREELPKVFEKFYQVDPDNTGQIRGFGLGLFYARQFVTSHGGRLSLQSEPGTRTVATVELPID